MRKIHISTFVASHTSISEISVLLTYFLNLPIAFLETQYQLKFIKSPYFIVKKNDQNIKTALRLRLL